MTKTFLFVLAVSCYVWSRVMCTAAWGLGGLEASNRLKTANNDKHRNVTPIFDSAG